jgi:hypothetical protein
VYSDENGIPLTVKPTQKSWQLLTTSYNTADCSGTDTIVGTDTLNIQIVPQTEKIYQYWTLYAIYNGTASSMTPSKVDVIAVVNATCDFIKAHINDALLLRVAMKTNRFLCLLHPSSWNDNVTSSSLSPLIIKYRIVYNLIELPTLSRYNNNNRDILMNIESYNYMRGLFNDTNKIGIYGDATMSAWVKNKLSNINPYKNYSTISILHL